MATNSTADGTDVTPRVDVYESQEDVLILADLPGVRKEDLAVRFERSALVIEAARANGGRYRRAFDVPAAFDATKVDAELKQGVLTLKVPRTEAAKPRRIEVHSV